MAGEAETALGPPVPCRRAVLWAMAVVALEWSASGLAKLAAGPSYFAGFREAVLGMASMMSPPWFERFLERRVLVGDVPAVASLVLWGELALGASFLGLSAALAMRPLPRPALWFGALASAAGCAYSLALSAYMGDIVVPGKANPFYEGVGLDLLLALVHGVLFASFARSLMASPPRPTPKPPGAAEGRVAPDAFPWVGAATALQCLLAYEWLDSAAAKLAHYPFFASHFAEWVTDHAAILSPAWFAALVRASVGLAPGVWPPAVLAFEALLGLALFGSALGMGRDPAAWARLGRAASLGAVLYSALLLLYQGEPLLPFGGEPFDEAVGLNLALALLQAALAWRFFPPGLEAVARPEARPQISSTIGRIIGRRFVFSKRKWASASRTRLLIVDHSVTGVPFRPVSACITRWRASSRSFSDSRT